jgi:HNH endonuclease
MSKNRKVRDVRERFFEKVDTGNTVNGCWLWLAGKNHQKYGRFYYDGWDQPAHRVAYILANGPVDPKLLACHSCDQPSCVNPSHIFMGTQKQNMEDCKKKGRFATHIGEANPRARLTNAQVIQIRKLFDSGLYTRRALIKMYKIPASTLDNVIYRINWKHL